MAHQRTFAASMLADSMQRPAPATRSMGPDAAPAAPMPRPQIPDRSGPAGLPHTIHFPKTQIEGFEDIRPGDQAVVEVTMQIEQVSDQGEVAATLLDVAYAPHERRPPFEQAGAKASRMMMQQQPMPAPPAGEEV